MPPAFSADCRICCLYLVIRSPSRISGVTASTSSPCPFSAGNRLFSLPDGHLCRSPGLDPVPRLLLPGCPGLRSPHLPYPQRRIRNFRRPRSHPGIRCSGSPPAPPGCRPCAGHGGLSLRTKKQNRRSLCSLLISATSNITPFLLFYILYKWACSF